MTTTTLAPTTRALDYAINTAEGPAALEQGVRTVLTLALAEFQQADPGTFVLLPLTQGVTNILFKCTLTKPDGTANKVLVRIYGAGTDAIIDRDKEIRVLKFLGEHGVCPPVYATFKNGMVYGYVQGRSLQPTQLADKAAQIGAAVARLHLLTALAVREQILPISEPISEPMVEQTPPCQQFATLRAWLQQLPVQVGEFTRSELARKIDWLEAALLARHMRTVFSHNDLLGPNIILTPDERIFFIDYEYANYNLRGFDFANHFCEYAGFELDYTRYPSLETRRAAVEGYLTESKLDLSQVDAMVREIEECVPLSHLFWGVWGLVQHGISTIQFDYLSYGRTRLAMYETTRQILVRAEHEQREPANQ